MSNVIWMAVIVALAAIGMCMAFAGTRTSRLSQVLADHDRNEARLRAEQQERSDKGAA